MLVEAVNKVSIWVFGELLKGAVLSSLGGIWIMLVVRINTNYFLTLLECIFFGINRKKLGCTVLGSLLSQQSGSLFFVLFFV